MANEQQTTEARDVYLNLLRAHEMVFGEFSKLFKNHGVTSVQYNVLRILIGGPKTGVPCQYIAERLVNREPDVTRLVDRMAKAGLVERQRSEEDRRVVLVKITAAGRKKADRLRRPVDSLHVEQVAHMTKRQMTALRDGLSALLGDKAP